MKRNLILIVSMLFCLTSFAQNVIQPKIMVIPYTKEGEDIRTILEKDANKRIILTKIKEAFDGKGYTTVDFTARLKAAESGQIFNSDNKSDLKSQIIEMSGADIYVEAEITCIQANVAGQSKPESDVKIIITGYECATGNSLANKVGESGKFYTDDIGKLAMRAIGSCIDDFLNVMQAKFSDIAENGKSVIIHIGFDDNSRYTMQSEVGTQGLQLSDEIELWISEKAYKNNYHLQGATKNLMIFDDVKVPLIDEKTGNNFTLSRFGLDFLGFFRTLGIPITRDIKGNTLYITIK
ncbi:MAG: DUF6175 family protein [Bacteroidales bacterium]|jgi:hypothetical protein|nr:DUF6175 family protein [Bacteroidales bacterium]